MSLVAELGEGYIREFCTNALLLKDKLLYRLMDCNSGQLIAAVLNLDDPKGKWSTTSLPNDTLTSFTDFAWPKLGYRNIDTEKHGNVAVFLTAQRSVMRGLRMDLIEFKLIEVAATFNISLWSGRGDPEMKQYRAVFGHTFPSFKEGMMKVKAGEWCSFALNEDLAVAVATSGGPDAYCDIYFRDKRVGELTSKGEILLANKVIKHSTLTKLFSQE